MVSSEVDLGLKPIARLANQLEVVDPPVDNTKLLRISQQRFEYQDLGPGGRRIAGLVTPRPVQRRRAFCFGAEPRVYQHVKK